MNFPDGATPDFPSEIVFEIFLRLPVRSLCRFKCASKPWRSLISNPDFAKKHHQGNRKLQPERLFSFTDKLDYYSWDLESSEQSSVKLRIQDGPRPLFEKIWNSCDGLILLSCFRKSLFLVNPSTGEVRKLPRSPFSIDSSPFSIDSGKTVIKYGFGYDSSVDDYKVVKISFKKFRIPTSESNRNVVSVYNLRTNSWRKIESSTNGCFFPTILRDGVFVNGALHWVGRDCVIVLDLASESFHDMHSPISGDGTAMLLHGLNVCGDCLCGFEFDTNGSFNFWVMKEYGVRDSWVKFTVDYHDLHWIVPSRTGKLLIGMHRKLALYDPQLLIGETEDLPVGRVHSDAIRYEASLVRLL